MNDAYCPLPFKHAYVDNSGVSACCVSPRYKIPLRDWASSKPLIEMQQRILNNEVPDSCKICHSNEKTFNESLRTAALRNYNKQVFTESDIDFVDYRSSNICNFKCRSCSPTFSHGIAHEAKNTPGLQRYFNICPDAKTLSLAEEDQQWVWDNLDRIKRLMLTGGEPTMIPRIKDIVNLIAEKYADKIQLLITSNLSFSDPLWYKITTTMPNIHWTASIDAVGEAAEIIRHGTDWSTVEQNLNWLAINAPSLNINTVVTNLSLFQLGQVLVLGREMQKKSIQPSSRHGTDGCRHQFAILPVGNMLAVDNLPPELAEKALPYLHSCLELDLDTEQKDTVNGLIERLKNYKFNPVLWDKFKHYNKTLDGLRGENYKKLFPQ